MKLLRFLLFSSFFLSLPFFMKKEFKLPPTHAHFSADPRWDTFSPSPEIEAILKAPFHYYAKGNQSTVFLSEDGKYVFKLFRYRRSIFPAMHSLRNFYKKKAKLPFENKLKKTFDGAHLACHEGSSFTKAIYCHLNLSQNTLPVAKLKVGNKTYHLPLDRARFVIQKKAENFKNTLLAAKANPDEMHRLITSFRDLLVNRTKKNIRNSDPNLGPNFGFLEAQAVEIDFGNYQKIKPDRKREKEEVRHFLMSLEQWLADNAVEYLPFAIDLRLKTEIAYDAEE